MRPGEASAPPSFKLFLTRSTLKFQFSVALKLVDHVNQSGLNVGFSCNTMCHMTPARYCFFLSYEISASKISRNFCSSWYYALKILFIATTFTEVSTLFMLALFIDKHLRVPTNFLEMDGK